MVPLSIQTLVPSPWSCTPQNCILTQNHWAQAQMPEIAGRGHWVGGPCRLPGCEGIHPGPLRVQVSRCQAQMVHTVFSGETVGFKQEPRQVGRKWRGAGREEAATRRHQTPRLICHEPACWGLCTPIPGVAEELKSFLVSQDQTPQIPATAFRVYPGAH